MIALAMLPLLVFGAAAAVSRPAPSPPIVPALVRTEGVTVRRLDDGTFRMRWAPVNDMPPAIEVRRYPVPELVANSAGAVVEPTAPPSSRRLHSRPAQLDICARHKMRKVHYGRTWRCRR